MTLMMMMRNILDDVDPGEGHRKMCKAENKKRNADRERIPTFSFLH